MCRCCQICWEDFYWNCFEERFCYDESIANYNPEDDEDYIVSQKNGNILGQIQSADNNNLRVPAIICDQPIRRNHSSILSNAKIHEEDYRRETQTNMPMLGPEILAVFANSQIFQDHQPTKLTRISTTKSNMIGIHSPKSEQQDRLMRRLEGNYGSVTDVNADIRETSSDKRIIFTITSESSPEGSQILTSKKFDSIVEEDLDGVILRPRLIDRHQHLLPVMSASPRKVLRNAKSVPHFNVRPTASETDIFSITGSGNPISMTPEVPSISYTHLPKNYEDTPTIEKYRVSQSLYSIQTTNAAIATSRDDYSMPRYFRRSALMSQSSEVLVDPSAASSREEIHSRPEKEKSKRLQRLRGTLPPLLIHSVSFRKTRDETKQVH
ncbi:uncharacterized protein LOC119640431 [Glossina fuscipes]|uniref:Uncharacterized protein LOC119640431 n=1 Tax=Glossina fuscipes TaxID=7396 RepID=A0A9C5ZD91_9MUSC|nr:uncharacterized protein LOC119640431 [Glossina fuscipes]XP_037894398.1 uncharacterized protein LOC119640431 [Glossina fuscipes]XP_037894399.1 uncharacterized protein LOC119640431 [Glossina fuscipes]XP_037894400.1 uncharacterized protein LOC119640431 [Glossina fuscipes]XP_037894401.1 uncharacterized protein LOC119640431 [Glossina fuscipes]XP_037894402.1 uncharacterized protein LOC119640431 [Glossina fuscipes]XP_037894403.1 uncharacterized protein LOC119640431 [Glossina fuscipes]KAI9578493.